MPSLPFHLPLPRSAWCVCVQSVQRKEGKPLASTIVQRLQRYSAENAFKRTILDMITNGGRVGKPLNPKP